MFNERTNSVCFLGEFTTEALNVQTEPVRYSWKPEELHLHEFFRAYGDDERFRSYYTFNSSYL